MKLMVLLPRCFAMERVTETQKNHITHAFTITALQNQTEEGYLPYKDCLGNPWSVGRDHW